MPTPAAARPPTPRRSGWDTWHRDRGAELPADWNRPGGPRARVLRRDRGLCRWRGPGGVVCLKPGNRVDHIGDPHDHRDENLRTLCLDHDRIRTSAQGVEAARAARTRPETAHPFATRAARQGRAGSTGRR